MNRLEPDGRQQPVDPAEADQMRYLEIDIGRRRRLLGWVAYILLFAAVCAGLVWFFLYFNTPLRMAVALVAFMVGYMVLMGRWASRNIEQTWSQESRRR